VFGTRLENQATGLLFELFLRSQLAFVLLLTG